MDKPIGSSLPSPAIRSTTDTPYTPQIERFDQLMQAYTKDWPALYADGSEREPGSYERLAANILAAIAWVNRSHLGKGPGEAAWAGDTLKQSLDHTCDQEKVASEGTSLAIADEIVRMYQEANNVGERSITVATLAQSVLKAVSERMRKAGGDSAFQARNIEKLDAAELLPKMEHNPPSSRWAADEAFADPLYCYALTAWANLGPNDEVPQRSKAVDEILRNPRYPYLVCLGLTSLPTLPASLVKLDVSQNKLTRLPVLPDKLESLKASINQLTSLPTLPDLVKLDVAFNELKSPPELPHTLKKVDLDGLDFDDTWLECFQSLKEGTEVRIQEQRSTPLQAKLLSLMEERKLDLVLIDLHGS